MTKRLRERRGLVRSMVTAMATRPFLILAGVSGSGKTQLARRLAAALAAGGLDEGRYTHCLRGVEHGLHHAIARAIVETEVAPEAFAAGDRASYIDVHELSTLDDWGESGEPGPGQRSYLDVMSNRVAFLAVRPEWRDSAQLWGTYNPLTGLYYPTRALRVFQHALLEFLHLGERAGRHVIILDEMNLARVEYYLSDLLSLMESPARVTADGRLRLGEMARVHPFKAPLWTESAPRVPGQPQSTAEHLFYGRMERGWARALRVLSPQAANYVVDPVPVDFDEVIDGADWYRVVPPALCMPPNLTIIGTINVDETTFALAPKVLDRAFVVEFEHIDFDAVCHDWEGYDALRDEVLALHAILAPARLHFGYRVVGEMLAYLEASGGDWAQEGDFLMLSRVLPRLGGLEAQVGPALRGLLAYCMGVSGDAWRAYPEALDATTLAQLMTAMGVSHAPHPRSARRLLSMVRELHQTGVTSFL